MNKDIIMTKDKEVEGRSLKEIEKKVSEELSSLRLNIKLSNIIYKDGPCTVSGKVSNRRVAEEFKVSVGSSNDVEEQAKDISKGIILDVLNIKEHDYVARYVEHLFV